MDEVALHKADVIGRCIQRVREEHAGNDTNVIENLTRQDSVILNIQRACEASIDLAMHLVRRFRLGVPRDSREAFRLLESTGRLDRETSHRMQRMVGFRNIAVHDYEAVNIDVVLAIVRDHLDDLSAFANRSIELTRES